MEITLLIMENHGIVILNFCGNPDMGSLPNPHELAFMICVLLFVEVLEEALNETDAGGLMADLLLMMLTAVFSLEEEEEQEELELAKESKDQGKILVASWLTCC